MVSCETNSPDFDFRSFLNLENEDDGVARSDALILWCYAAKLPPVFAEKLLEYRFCFLDPGGIKLTFHRETNFALAKPVEYVRLRYAVDSLVTNSPDDGPFLYFENDDLQIGISRRVFDTQLNVLKVRGIP